MFDFSFTADPHCVHLNGDCSPPSLSVWRSHVSCELCPPSLPAGCCGILFFRGAIFLAFRSWHVSTLLLSFALSTVFLFHGLSRKGSSLPMVVVIHHCIHRYHDDQQRVEGRDSTSSSILPLWHANMHDLFVCLAKWSRNCVHNRHVHNPRGTFLIFRSDFSHIPFNLVGAENQQHAPLYQHTDNESANAHPVCAKHKRQHSFFQVLLHGWVRYLTFCQRFPGVAHARCEFGSHFIFHPWILTIIVTAFRLNIHVLANHEDFQEFFLCVFSQMQSSCIVFNFCPRPSRGCSTSCFSIHA